MRLVWSLFFLNQNGYVGVNPQSFGSETRRTMAACLGGFTPQLMAISLNGKNDDKASQILGYHVLGYSQIPSLHRNFSLWLYAPTNLGRNTLAGLRNFLLVAIDRLKPIESYRFVLTGFHLHEISIGHVYREFKAFLSLFGFQKHSIFSF